MYIVQTIMSYSKFNTLEEARESATHYDAYTIYDAKEIESALRYFVVIHLKASSTFVLATPHKTKEEAEVEARLQVSSNDTYEIYQGKKLAS